MNVAPETDFPPLPGIEGAARRPLRVCVASWELAGPHRTGGIGTAMTGLAEALAVAGHDVTALHIPYYPSPPIEESIERYRAAGIRLVRLPVEEAPLVGPPVARASYAAYRWLRGERFDAVHFPDFGGHAFFAVRAKRQGLAFAGTTFCIGAHGSLAWSRASNGVPVQSVDALVADHLERATVESADVLVSPSRYLLRWMAAQGWRLPSESYVQQNIVSIPDLHPRPDPPGERVLPAAKEGPLEIVFFARLEARKGLLLFCDALDALSKRAPAGLSVKFVGKANRVGRRDALEVLHERGAGWRFPWEAAGDLDREEALGLLASGRRVAVIPSLVDNLPCTVVECLALGIPFLASRVGGIPELVAPDDAAAVLVEPRVDAWVERLAALLAGGPLPRARPAVDLAAARRGWLAWHARLAFVVGGRPQDVLAGRLRGRPPRPPVDRGLVERPALDSTAAPGPDPRVSPPAASGSRPVPRVGVRFLKGRQPGSVAALEPIAAQDGVRVEVLAPGNGTAPDAAPPDYVLFLHEAVAARGRDALATLVGAAEHAGVPVATCFADVRGDAATPERRAVYAAAPTAIALAWERGHPAVLVRVGASAALDAIALGEVPPGAALEDVAEPTDVLLRAIGAGTEPDIVPEALFRSPLPPPPAHTALFHARRGVEAVLGAVPPELRDLCRLAAEPPSRQARPDRTEASLRLLRSPWWRATAPFRNAARGLLGEPPERRPAIGSAAEAAAVVRQIEESASWDLTAPLRWAASSIPAASASAFARRARSGWRRLRTRASLRWVAGARSVPYGRDEAIAIAVVRDAAAYLPTFIEHHLGLGVKHLVLVDNGSTDGTVELARGHERVTLLECDLRFDRYGNLARRAAWQRFGRGRWTLVLDADERFDYPFSDAVPLGHLLRYLERRSATALVAQMLDLFGPEPVAAARSDPDEAIRREHRFYDVSAVAARPYPWPGNTLGSAAVRWLEGGVRRTAFGVNPWLTKHPLLFHDGRVDMDDDNAHVVSGARITDVTGLIRHYKFVRGFGDRVEDAVRRGIHQDDSAEYRRYRATLRADPELSLLGPSARELRSADDLVACGFLVVSEDYRRLAASLGAKGAAAAVEAGAGACGRPVRGG